MKIARVPLLAALALLAAAAAAKPPPAESADGGRDAWRGRAIGVCVAGLRGADGATASEIQAVCGCGVDRMMASWPAGSLPALGTDGIPLELRGPLVACASDQRPAVAVGVARRVAQSSSVVAPPPANGEEAKPAEEGAPAPAPGSPDAPKRERPDVGTWLGGLSLPAWLGDSGLPTWAWLILAVLAFLLLRGLFRRDDQRDLVGPPRSTRLGQPPAPPRPRVQPQRRPDS